MNARKNRTDRKISWSEDVRIDFIPNAVYNQRVKRYKGVISTDFVTIKEISEIWGISQRRICKLCEEERIIGAQKRGGVWFIPADTEKPRDLRIKSGRYVTVRN